MHCKRISYGQPTVLSSLDTFINERKSCNPCICFAAALILSTSKPRLLSMKKPEKHTFLTVFPGICNGRATHGTKKHRCISSIGINASAWNLLFGTVSGVLFLATANRYRYVRLMAYRREQNALVTGVAFNTRIGSFQSSSLRFVFFTSSIGRKGLWPPRSRSTWTVVFRACTPASVLLR